MARVGAFISSAMLVILCAPMRAFAADEPFVFWSWLPVVGNQPHHVIAFSLTFVLVLTGALAFRSLISGAKESLPPGEKLGLRNIFEIICEATIGMMKDMIGPNYKKFFPLIGTCAFVILTSNIMGLIPGFSPPTDNINTTLACATVVIIYYHYQGIRAKGFLKYCASFMGPLEGTLKYALSWLMVPIELVSHTVRPVSLSLRLFGNMFGDHTVIATFMSLTFLPLIYPIPFVALGLLVAIVQTLVFCMLATVYLSLAISHEH